MTFNREVFKRDMQYVAAFLVFAALPVWIMTNYIYFNEYRCGDERLMKICVEDNCYTGLSGEMMCEGLEQQMLLGALLLSVSWWIFSLFIVALCWFGFLFFRWLYKRWFD